MTDSPGDTPREATRLNIYLAAELASENAHISVTIRNLSSTGAQIQARSALDSSDTAVTLARGSLRAKGTLVWSEGSLGGIEFADPINLAVWVPGKLNPGQANVDRAIAESRGHVSPGAVASYPPPPSSSSMAIRIAEELGVVSRKLEALGNELVDDPVVCTRYATKLQELDIATQVLGHLIRLLNAPHPEELLPTIGMDDLRRRLERAPLSPSA